jgi:hypothetical protein
MAPIIKLTRKTKTFLWIEECQKVWELIKQKYIETLMISPNWQVEFHVHTYVSLLVVGAMSSQNITWKSDQPIVYASRPLNRPEHNYNTIKREFFFFAQVQTLFVRQSVCLLCRSYGIGLFGQQTTCFKENS